MTFHRTMANDGFIKVNFISDDAIAIEINEAGRHVVVTDAKVKIPAVSSPAFMGGYCYPILAMMAGDRTYQILKAPLPSDSTPEQMKKVERICGQPETLYAYVDAGDVTMVQIEGWNRSATPMSDWGWIITNGPKTFKRLKTLNRPFRLWSMPTDAQGNVRPLRVAIVDDDSYTNEDLEGVPEELHERLLDGAMVISRKLYEECLENVRFPELDDDVNRPELAVNVYRSQEYMRQAQFFHAFNARIFGPMHFTGISHDDELWERPGMLKGEAFINVSDTCERMHVDVICARSALKFDVGNPDISFVLIEPQKAKLSGVSSDLQTMSNLPPLFQFKDVSSWTREFLLSWFEKLKNNELMSEWYDLSGRFFNSSSKFFDQNDVTSLTKWNARAWLMSGMKITESPWMFEQLGYAISKMLKVQTPSKLRFPVPCAVRAQVISQSFASMAGDDFNIIRGTARWSKALESIVVNDLDWIEMYSSHGGHDLDDFFVGYWRTINNERRIVVARSPNDWGEYSIFSYVDGDWFPVFESHTGDMMIFPEVSGDADMWAVRLSEMLEAKQIIYTGLPSQNNEQPKVDPHPYCYSDVLQLIHNNRASATCVGTNVNARTLWSLSTRRHRQVQLTSMETCIDTGTQGGSAEDAQAVMAEGKDIVAQIIADPTLKIDAYMWFTRFVEYNGMPFPRSRIDDKTHVSLAHKFRIDAAAEFNEHVRTFAQTKLSASVNPMVHRLGLRRIREGMSVLAQTRYAMVRMQTPGEHELIPGDWGDVNYLILEKLDSFDSEVDKHDFIMSLYSACFKLPTRAKRTTDQTVMNPHIFPYLIKAMRFYGIAAYIEATEEGKLVQRWEKEWELTCAGCKASFTTTDPVTLQAYHHYDGLCKTCRS